MYIRNIYDIYAYIYILLIYYIYIYHMYISCVYIYIYIYSDFFKKSIFVLSSIFRHQKRIYNLVQDLRWSFFCENSQLHLVVNSFHKKASS